MPLLPSLSSLWRNLFYKARKDQELTEEIETYLEMLIVQKINEGFSPAEARRAALIELGGREQVKEKVREARMGHQMETLRQDMRYALRMLRKNPAMTSIAVITLALGIGANTAIFSVVNALVFNPLPYPDPQRLVWVTNDFRGNEEIGVGNFRTYQTQSKTFDGLAAFDVGGGSLTTPDGPVGVNIVHATASLFPTLGVSPKLGRAFTPEEARPGAPPVIILSHELWRRRFGGDPAVVGRSVPFG